MIPCDHISGTEEHQEPCIMEFHKLSQHTHLGVQFSSLKATQKCRQVSESNNKIEINKLSFSTASAPWLDSKMF